MVQIGRRGTARRLFENFKKFSKITELEFQISGPSIFASVSPVYRKKFDSIRTKLTEEIHFEICHSGNLPPTVTCSGSTGGVAASSGSRRQRCADPENCVRIIPRILTTDPRTGGIRNCGRNRAVKTNRLVGFLSLSFLVSSSRAQVAPVDRF